MRISDHIKKPYLNFATSVFFFTRNLWQLLQVAHVPSEKLYRPATDDSKIYTHLQKIQREIAVSRWGRISKAYADLHLMLTIEQIDDERIRKALANFQQEYQASIDIKKIFMLTGSGRGTGDVVCSIKLLNDLVSIDMMSHNYTQLISMDIDDAISAVTEKADKTIISLDSAKKTAEGNVAEYKKFVSSAQQEIITINSLLSSAVTLYTDTNSLKRHLDSRDYEIDEGFLNRQVDKHSLSLNDLLSKISNSDSLIFRTPKYFPGNHNTINKFLQVNSISELLIKLLEKKLSLVNRELSFYQGALNKNIHCADQKYSDALPLKIRNLYLNNDLSIADPEWDASLRTIDFSAARQNLTEHALFIAQRIHLIPADHLTEGEFPTIMTLDKLPLLPIFTKNKTLLSSSVDYNSKIREIFQSFLGFSYATIKSFEAYGVTLKDIMHKGNELTAAANYFGLEKDSLVGEYALAYYKATYKKIEPVSVEVIDDSLVAYDSVIKKHMRQKRAVKKKLFKKWLKTQAPFLSAVENYTNPICFSCHKHDEDEKHTSNKSNIAGKICLSCHEIEQMELLQRNASKIKIIIEDDAVSVDSVESGYYTGREERSDTLTSTSTIDSGLSMPMSEQQRITNTQLVVSNILDEIVATLGEKKVTAKFHAENAELMQQINLCKSVKRNSREECQFFIKKIISKLLIIYKKLGTMRVNPMFDKLRGNKETKTQSKLIGFVNQLQRVANGTVVSLHPNHLPQTYHSPTPQSLS